MERILDLPVCPDRFQQRLRRELARQRKDPHLARCPAVDLASLLDAATCFQACKLMMPGETRRIDDDGDPRLDAAVRLGLAPGGGMATCDLGQF